MGEEQLLKAIAQEAADKCTEIISVAEELSAAELQRSRTESLARKNSALEEYKAVLEKEAADKISKARSRAAALILETKTNVIKDVFDEATRRIEGLDKERYRSFIKSLHDELKASWPAGLKGKVHINPADKTIFEPSSMALEPDSSVSLGVVFVSEDGTHRFENTTRSRLEKARTELVIKLNNMLFREDN